MKKTFFILAVTCFFGFFLVNVASAEVIDFPNPLAVDSVQGLASQIMSALEKIIVTVAIIMIVIGGIMYMLSMGDSGGTERAKKIITAAVIGLAIALGARTFLQEIWNILGVGSSVESPGGRTFYEIAASVLTLLLSLIGVLGIIGIMIGGIMYLTAYGDDDRITLGKNIMTASIIGITIALSAVILVRQIAQLLGVNLVQR